LQAAGISVNLKVMKNADLWGSPEPFDSILRQGGTVIENDDKSSVLREILLKKNYESMEGLQMG